MIRFAFTLLAALGLAAALGLFWPARPPEDPARASDEVATEPARSHGVATQASAPPPEEEIADAAGGAPPTPPAPRDPDDPDVRAAATSTEPPASSPASDRQAPAAEPVAPTLAEEPVEIVSRPDFRAGVAVPDADAQPAGVAVPDADAQPADVAVTDADAQPADVAVTDADAQPGDVAQAPPAEAPEPVDVDRSGDLIRRMLALYRSVSE